uniref:Phosphomannomutase n=1 Tax=Bursaphelenchus xylophilus TaxID=6326 RepID=A0A1I7S363_BURXY
MSTILLFDVDGTLTKPRQNISTDLKDFLVGVGKTVDIGVVGGSDLNKVVEQLGSDLELLKTELSYIFTENGLVGFKGAEQLPTMSIRDKLGEEKLQDVVNFCLDYIAKLKIPIKRGTFVEYRKGMLNVSPIGRNCSQEEREEFNRYDLVHGIRADFVKVLKERFSDYGLTFSIGGQISIDIFPNGWDKTFCLQYLERKYERIHFFGDKTAPGGNDYEIYEDKRTIGHTVTSPEDTKHKFI